MGSAEAANSNWDDWAAHSCVISANVIVASEKDALINNIFN